MPSPFINVSVQPSYGANKAIVSWTVQTGYEDADFYVYRSKNNGRPPWELINEEPATMGMLEDDNFVVENRLQQVYYRIYMKKDTEEYDSVIFSYFDKLSRRQYGGINKMMRLELKRMSTGNGIQVLHYIPLNKGEPNPNFDEETGQLLGPDCPEDAPEDDSYGQRYIGGYNSPLYTWLELPVRGADLLSDLDNGMGMDDTHIAQARMLAFPKPQRGHLIIHPSTDNRYVVGEHVKGHYFRGVVPVAYDTRLHLLRRGDPRYRVPVPDELPVPLWATI